MTSPEFRAKYNTSKHNNKYLQITVANQNYIHKEIRELNLRAA
jgi:hypothetical protein